jgi:hypothetical protein
MTLALHSKIPEVVVNNICLIWLDNKNQANNGLKKLVDLIIFFNRPPATDHLNLNGNDALSNAA